MRIKFLSKNLFKVIFIIAVFGLLVFLNPHKFFNPVRNVAIRIMLPIQGMFRELSFKFSKSRDFVASIGKLKKENEDLAAENQRLVAQNANLKDAQKENETLREQLKLLPRTKFDLISAYITKQDPYGTGNWIEINRGTSDGVEADMPVIVSDGILVGKIGDVYPNSSQVLLLTNPQSLINAYDVETGAKGIARGEYGLGIILDMVLDSDSLQVGNNVMTSDIGKNIPAGLLVGTVQEIRNSPDKLFQQAIINSPVKISSLQYVFVVKRRF